MTDKSGQPLVTGLLRGLAVLRCFDHGRERLGSSEIARLTGLPQPTVWRLCKTLEHGGYLVSDAEARFRPGLSILTLGYSALDTLELSELARPLLEDLAAHFRGAACLSTREHTSMLYVQRSEAAGSYLSVNLRVGSEVPIISSGTGWAYLASLSPAALKQVLHECRQADPALYRKAEGPAQQALGEFAQNGYVSNIDVFYPGLATVAVPVGEAASGSTYVLNCTAASGVFSTAAARRKAGLALIRAANQLRPALAGA